MNNEMNKNQIDTILSLNGVRKYFGALHAVEDVSFNVERGKIVALIGPNGAGKTTLINLITGYYNVTAGSIIFNNKNITNFADYRVCQLGIGRTFQKIKLFKKISVLDNVLIGMYLHTNSGPISCMLNTKNNRKEEHAAIEQAIELLSYMGIEQFWESPAEELSYGDQRRLEIARALATKPKLLLLDEPVAGMNPIEKMQMISLIRDIQSKGTTVLLIEHDMKMVMRLAEKVIVVDHGEKIAEGLLKTSKTINRSLKLI